MASEITYAEVKFKNESTCSGTNSASPAVLKEKTTVHKSNHGFSKLILSSLFILLLLLAISFFIAFIVFFQKYSQLHEKKKMTKELIHTTLECMKKNKTMQGSFWSCCPKNWKSFGSNCYFVSTESKSWHESEKDCSRMGAHLLVINSKAEQDFIIKDLNRRSAYYVGLSDPEGQGHWQWVDQTPYDESISFWHPSEPNNPDEQCVILSLPSVYHQWGLNDVRCDSPQRSVCKMMEIYL